MPDWGWTALIGIAVLVDWALGSRVLMFGWLRKPTPERAAQLRASGPLLAVVFAGLAVAQYLAHGR